MAAIEEIIAALRALDDAEGVERQIAGRAATKLSKALASNLAAGLDPNGEPWPERKTGGRAYQHAAARLKVAAEGALVVATIDGPEAWGHYGTKRLPARKMLPDAAGSVPPIVTDAITGAAREILDEATR